MNALKQCFRRFFLNKDHLNSPFYVCLNKKYYLKSIKFEYKK